MAKVLLVDDDLGDLILMQKALQTAAPDVTISTARIHEDALRAAPGCDLVLLDLNMAGTHGLEILKDLRAQEATADLPIVVFTTSAAERDVGAAYERGANAFITKPADLQGTIAMMASTTRFWLEVACAS